MDKSIELKTYNYEEEIIERLEIQKSALSYEKVRVFDRCFPGQPGEYYHDNLTYSKGNEYLIREIGKRAPEASGDGYCSFYTKLQRTNGSPGTRTNGYGISVHFLPPGSGKAYYHTRDELKRLARN